MQESSQRTTIKRIKKDFRLMPSFAISPRRFASLRCERQAALVMRTIRRQVYARDRHLALLPRRQGKCRCAELFAPLPAILVVGALRQLCALFGLSSQKFHGSHISDSSNSRLLHCTISYFALQRKLHGLSTGF